MSIVSVTSNARFGGQAIMNTYWYRVALALPFAELLGFAQAIGAEWLEGIWDNGSADDLKSIMPTTFTLDTLSVDFRDDDGVLLNSIPFEIIVNDPGTLVAAYDSPASYAVMHCSLGNAQGPGLDLPRRGYLAIGPLPNTAIGDDGVLQAGILASLTALGVRIATNLVTVAPPGALFPIRVRLNKLNLLPDYYRYRDVEACFPRTRVRYRKSRLPSLTAE